MRVLVVEDNAINFMVSGWRGWRFSVWFGAVTRSFVGGCDVVSSPSRPCGPLRSQVLDIMLQKLETTVCRRRTFAVPTCGLSAARLMVTDCVCCALSVVCVAGDVGAGRRARACGA